MRLTGQLYPARAAENMASSGLLCTRKTPCDLGQGDKVFMVFFEHGELTNQSFLIHLLL